MKLLLFLAVGLATAGANQESITGHISDSMCAGKHEAPAEGGPELSARDCTVACVRGGSKYVLASEEKVYQLEGVTDFDLEKLAGEKVTVTGEVSGDSLRVETIKSAEP